MPAQNLIQYSQLSKFEHLRHCKRAAHPCTNEEKTWQFRKIRKKGPYIHIQHTHQHKGQYKQVYYMGSECVLIGKLHLRYYIGTYFKHKNPGTKVLKGKDNAYP